MVRPLKVSILDISSRFIDTDENPTKPNFSTTTTTKTPLITTSATLLMVVNDVSASLVTSDNNEDVDTAANEFLFPTGSPISLYCDPDAVVTMAFDFALAGSCNADVVIIPSSHTPAKLPDGNIRQLYTVFTA